MKIKRFTADSIRIALEMVREEQGPDAVILSSKKLDQGVEVVAATDYDEAILHQMKDAKGAKGAKSAEPLLSNSGEEDDQSEYNSLKEEFGSLRSLVQSRLSQLSWSHLSQDRPEHAALVRSLTGIGLSGDVVADLARDLEAINDPANAWREALALFARRIPLALSDVVAQGGRFAFVGTTGVGKTTIASKLAARYVLQNGDANIGIISYDPQAMAAPDQLLRTGTVLGIPVQKARGPVDLRDTLSQLDSKKLVLIDTPGRSPRAPDFDASLVGLAEPVNRIRPILTLAGNAQEGFLRETVDRYRHLEMEGIAITKLDETTNLGGLLSLLIRERLPISYICEGQDLHNGLRSGHDCRASIASRAVSLAKRFREPDNAEPLEPQSNSHSILAQA